MIITRRIMTPPTRHKRIFISQSLAKYPIVIERGGQTFHHICFRTRFAPRRNPCAETARLSFNQVSSYSGEGNRIPVFDSRLSNLSPRSATLLILSRIIPTYRRVSWIQKLPHPQNPKRTEMSQESNARFQLLQIHGDEGYNGEGSNTVSSICA